VVYLTKDAINLALTYQLLPLTEKPLRFFTTGCFERLPALMVAVAPRDVPSVPALK
jgi:hypothetical protein